MMMILWASQGVSMAADAPTRAALIEQARASVVYLTVEGETATGSPVASAGTGFLIADNGFVLTAAHVIPATKDSPRIMGSLQSRYATPALLQLIARDPLFDFALLKFADTSRKWNPVKLGDPWALHPGDELFALGFPLNTEFGAKFGTLVGTGGPNGAWITDIALNPGDSGGPVLSADGAVVAVVIAALNQADGIKFVLPITYANGLIKTTGALVLSATDSSRTPARRTEIVSYPVSQTREATDKLTPSSAMYSQVIRARDGLLITQANLVRKSDTRLSDISLVVAPDMRSATLSYRLTSGPVYDRYRGWLEGEIVTTQEAR